MNPLRVLMVVSEAFPYAKTGGLADVAGSLPLALKDLGVDVRVLLPFYRQVEERQFPLQLLAEGLQSLYWDEPLDFDLVGTTDSPVPFYFVVREEFFSRPQLYNTSKGDYCDNLERFVFFCAAVKSVCQALDFAPDILHCHDWQASLAAVYLRHRWREEPLFANTKALLTIHNLAFQGRFPKKKFPLLGLDWSLFSIDGLEFYGDINLLKGGILFADAINTVSRGYSQEIQTPEYGFLLDGVLRSRSRVLFGILNGVDYKDWNPETDTFIAATYGPQNLKGKAKNKRALMEAFKLDKKRAKSPLLGMVSRLTDQKGIDLLIKIIPSLMAQNVLVVVLGKGDHHYEEELLALADKYPDQLGVKIAFDEGLAHLIEAGADMFLMPSRFEPSGLNQMYSMKYGTIPIVRATGGLMDTVTPVDKESGQGTGFLFREASPEAFGKAIQQALEAYQDKKLWKRIMLNAMAEDFSWPTSATSYLELYHRLAAGEIP